MNHISQVAVGSIRLVLMLMLCFFQMFNWKIRVCCFAYCQNVSNLVEACNLGFTLKSFQNMFRSGRDCAASHPLRFHTLSFTFSAKLAESLFLLTKPIALLAIAIASRLPLSSSFRKLSFLSSLTM